MIPAAAQSKRTDREPNRTGVTGYIGGSAFAYIYRAHSDWEYTLLVRNEERAKPVKEQYQNVNFVYGGLDDAQVVEKAAADADIVVHTADSSDHEAGAKAIAKGLKEGHSADKPGYWIHTSGTSILTWYDVENKRYGREPLAEQKYHDIDDIDRILSLPDQADHRVVDKIVQASNSDAVKIAIVAPPTIYGTGSGPGNTRSIQVPNMVKGTLEKGFAPIVGIGKTEWDNVHIDDLSDLFVNLVDATQDSSKRENTEIFGLHAYYFTENGSHAWADIAHWVADEASRQGYLPEGLTKSVSEREVELMNGISTPSYGLNSKGVAERARKYLGWQPKGHSLKDEISELKLDNSIVMEYYPFRPQYGTGGYPYFGSCRGRNKAERAGESTASMNRPSIEAKKIWKRVGAKMRFAQRHENRWLTGPPHIGTTYSCVATYEGSNVEIIANEQGSFTTPSFVSFTDKERLIGEAAKNNAAMNPINTVFDAKRLIGRRFDDPTVKKDIESWPFKVVDDNGQPKIQVEYLGETKTFSAQEISAMVLLKMKEIAEVKLGKKVEKAVITVPAYFNDNQRQATKDAGAISGLNVLRIINEPTAAAIAYGLGSNKSEKERNVLIYDLGGGTFDVSLLNIQGGVFTVKATAGDTHLGGQDFDTNLLDHCKKEFTRKSKKDLSGDARALRRLRTACERAKRTLSSGAQATIEIDSLFDGEDFTMTITRARFEDLNAKAFSGTLEPVAQVLKDAAIEKSAVDEIVLVGGSTRIPKIQKLLSEFFNGKKLEKSINPDEAVAWGAAVQAGILSGKATSAETSDLLLLDVIPLSLGVAMEGNIFAPVVPRGTTVPTLKKRSFTTVADNQQTVQFPVFQGERVNCEDNTSLGEFTLAPIPPMRAGEAVLEVVFEVDVNGLLKVTATEKTSGRSANISISNSVGKLSTGEIEKMISDAEAFKSNDEAFSKRFEAKQSLESYIGRVEEIVSDPTLSLKLKRGQKDKIESTISDAMAALELNESSADDLKKQELALKRLVTKAMSSR
ncbi:Ribosome-associated molecular chaperone SSB1 [Paramyrothecium foliicola]|nr:Ribosome-associated molecular chaperone SSB1 [Paramyrothecium foliicola]